MDGGGLNPLVTLNPDSTRPGPTDGAAACRGRGYRETPYSIVHSPPKPKTQNPPTSAHNFEIDGVEGRQRATCHCVAGTLSVLASPPRISGISETRVPVVILQLELVEFMNNYN